jgi:hypothetical protein
MASYLFKCRECGSRRTARSHDAEMDCFNCADDGVDSRMVRDWKGEAVGFTTVPGGYKEANRGR